jgi:LmbE family N-acetylglucosaminyl deacetylase
MPNPDEILRTWQALPWADSVPFPPGRRALVLAPHPDDETLGCGGLIAACCAAGRPPIVAVLTDGAGSHGNLDPSSKTLLREQRQREVRRATQCLGVPAEHLILLGFPDMGLADAAGACAGLLTLLARVHACDSIVAPSCYDPHPDHKAAAAIAETVAVTVGLSCLFYLTWAWIFPPETNQANPAVQGWRLDISHHLPAKRRAIVAHESQYFGLSDDPKRTCLPAELLAIAQREYEVILAG